jgi:hypothetical protein
MDGLEAWEVSVASSRLLAFEKKLTLHRPEVNKSHTGKRTRIHCHFDKEAIRIELRRGTRGSALIPGVIHAQLPG